MVYKTTSSLLAFLFISSILLAMTWQAAARNNIPKNTETQDKKEPEWFSHSGGSFSIPGIGRVGLPHKFRLKPAPQTPYNGGSGASGSGSGSAPQTPYNGGSGASGSGRSYVPGGDDTFVPNPGFELPIPGSGGRVPAAAHP